MLGLHCCTAGLSLVAVSGQLVVLHPHLYQLSFWDLLSPELSSYLFFLHCLILLQCFFFSHLLFLKEELGVWLVVFSIVHYRLYSLLVKLDRLYVYEVGFKTLLKTGHR